MPCVSVCTDTDCYLMVPEVAGCRVRDPNPGVPITDRVALREYSKIGYLPTYVVSQNSSI